MGRVRFQRSGRQVRYSNDESIPLGCRILSEESSNGRVYWVSPDPLRPTVVLGTRRRMM